MTKSEALKKGYCKHCAAYRNGRQYCGVGRNICTDCCLLPDEVQVRFRAEHGLEGETKRHHKPTFGDISIIKPKRGRKKR